ncbi:MAG: pyridoxamine 5'-phosphate oxidase family protein [Chitinivibrionales bacterium]|nr:pyridoxamine 5'-phosphate oxidase family protein [Chitinivibrionales bacterium]
MRRAEREIPDPADVERVLLSSPVCRIGLVDTDWPYVVPVAFGYRDRCLYFHSAHEGMKVDILKRNPRVCFEADTDIELVCGDNACGYSFRYRSVIGFGTAQILEGDTEKRAGLDVIMAHYAKGSFTYAPAMLSRMLVVRVDIERMSGKQSGW